MYTYSIPIHVAQYVTSRLGDDNWCTFAANKLSTAKGKTAFDKKAKGQYNLQSFNFHAIVVRTFAGYSGECVVHIYATHSHSQLLMSLTKQKKANAIKSQKRHDTDSGSPEVQVSLLTRQIEELAKHLKKHQNDFHSRRGLLQMVADRRKHLKYLERKNAKAYAKLIEQLGLKR